MERFRAEIARGGFCVVDATGLVLLCPGLMYINQQFQLIAEISMREKWSFTFHSDGSVEFAPLDLPSAGFSPVH